MVQVELNPPAIQKVQETWVLSLDWEDPLEEGMPTHSSILTRKIDPLDRGDWEAAVHGIAVSQTQLSTHTHLLNRQEFFSCLGMMYFISSFVFSNLIYLLTYLPISSLSTYLPTFLTVVEFGCL